MKKNFFVLSIIIFVIFFTGLSLPSCGKKTSSQTTTSPEPTATLTLNEAPLDTVDAITLDPTLTANYEASDKEAKKWKNNAQLVMVSVKLPQDLTLNNSTETYTYGSQDETNYWWTYSLSEQSGKFVRALVYKDDYIGKNLTPINIKYWRTNYIEAFQIAENYQGKEFRANNENTSVTLTLSVSEPKGWLWWLVEYKNPLGANYSVRINPNDKTIVDETGTVIAQGSTYQPTGTTTTPSATSTPSITQSPTPLPTK